MQHMKCKCAKPNIEILVGKPNFKTQLHHYELFT